MYSLLKNGVAWRSDFEIFFILEADINYLKTRLPGRLKPLEVRPGIGLVAIGVQDFLPGNLNGKLDRFQEIHMQIMIQPDLKLDFPLPDLALFVTHVSSEDPMFLAYSNEVDKMPVYTSSSLKIINRKEKHKLYSEASDENGPIYSVEVKLDEQYRNQKSLYVQAYTCLEDQLYCVPCRWEGLLYESQNKDLINYEIHDHPFFNFDASKIYDECYSIMAASGNGAITIDFYPPLKY